jgi:hypothetical protein
MIDPADHLKAAMDAVDAGLQESVEALNHLPVEARPQSRPAVSLPASVSIYADAIGCIAALLREGRREELANIHNFLARSLTLLNGRHP